MVRTVRSCISCRKRSQKGSLVRVVSCEGMLLLDIEQRRPGRGAYLHAECVLKIPPKNVWEKMLRLKSGALAPDAVRTLRESMLRKNILLNC